MCIIMPKTKQIFHIEYSSPPSFSNEDVLWYLHSIAMNIELEEGELQGKQLRLTLEDINYEEE